MIEATINKILTSLNNLPKEYKIALYKIFVGLADGIKTLNETKVDKEDGKGLSSNDFTDDLKNKLDDIEPGATAQVPSDWESISGVSRILNKPDLRVYPDSAKWDSTDKKIYFKHQGTIINAFTIDGTDFIKDGMIDDVKIEGDDLVITFNVEAGKEDIHIPLSEVFNPNNYYTKAKIDELFVKKVNGKDLSTEDFTTELKEKLENIDIEGITDEEIDELINE